ncbi:protein odr-4 homolog [Oncorhynchus keta]|uniref:protein odr-4 homolog n=1 Tax=Oncorhynchus keta TaxID=8018 RepID=UPI00227AFE0E|nr:protein odr-4 homolog [Oncorhynchus keta]
MGKGMGKGIIADAAVEKYFADLKASTSYILGLLVGQGEFVVHAAMTPLKEDNPGGLMNEDDKDYILDHAEHLNRMVPGGLSVMGMFVVSPSHQTKESHMKMRRTMAAVENRVSEDRLWGFSEEDTNDRVMLHICSNTNKVTCWIMNIKEPSKSSKSATWSYLPWMTAFWPVAVCPMDIDLMFPIKDKTRHGLMQAMKDGMMRWAKKTEASVCLLNNKNLPAKTNLNPPTKRNNSQRIKIQGQIFIPTTGGKLGERPSTASVQVCSCILRLKGSLGCRAYMNPARTTAKTTTMYIKRDIIRSVYNSAKNFFEHLINDENSAKAFMGSQPLAKRVFFLVPDTGISLCDYILSSETEAAVQERVREWAGFTIPDGQLHITQQLVQGRLEWHQDSEEGMDSTWVPVYKIQQRRKITMGVAVASGVSLVACLIYSLFLEE